LKKNYTILIVVGIAVAVIALVFFSMQKKKDKNFDWSQTYMDQDKNPYGTYYIYEMLQGYFEGYEFEDLKTNFAETDLENLEEPAIYIFVGDYQGWDYKDCSDFLDFISKGNQGFISARIVPDDLMNMINNWYSKKYDGNLFFTARKANATFTEYENAGPFSFNFKEKDFDSFYKWDYFNKIVTEHEILGYIGEKENFVKIPYGEGVLYLHSTPLTFTNFHMIEDKGYEHASLVFSYLEPANIYWDKKLAVDRNITEKPKNRNSVSPLSYILSQQSLRWAWYLLVLLVVMFFLFRSKRRQRIIPVILPNVNTSLEFAKTIGRLYYKQNDHQKLAGYKVRNFTLFVRNRYRISTKTIDNKFAERLAEKSETSLKDIQYIVNTINYINENQISGDLLIQFHLALDTFYKNCK